MNKSSKKEPEIVFPWTKEQEELLAEWSEKATCYRWLHSRSEKSYRAKNYLFTMEKLLNFVQDEFISKNDIPEFSPGDTITVYYQIREGQKVRTQFFKGVVIQIKGTGKTKTFTVRKMSGTVGIERIFPINLPSIKKIELNKKGKVRRSRIYYFKELRGKKARIKEVKK